MKKLFFAIITIALLTGCQKSKTDTAPLENSKVEKAWKIENGRIAFSSFATYRSFLETAPVDKQNFIQETEGQSGFVSASKSGKYLLNLKMSNRLAPTGNTEIDDEINDIISYSTLGNLINADGIVQIGNYLFNINLVTEKCYALHSSFLSNDSVAYNALLYEDVSKNYIFEFSTGDEVLSILEDWGYPLLKTSTQQIVERCEGTNRQKKRFQINYYFNEVPNYPQVRLNCKLVYQRAGIWFSLLSQMKYEYHGLIGWTQSTSYTWDAMKALYQWKYKARCQNEVIQGPVVYTASPGNNTYRERPYEGGRALVKYDMQFQWDVAGDEATGYTFLLTDVLRIASGY